MWPFKGRKQNPMPQLARERLGLRAGRPVEAPAAHDGVELDCAAEQHLLLADQFGESPPGVTAKGIHLEEPRAAVEVAHRTHQVELAFGPDVGNAQVVQVDPDRCSAGLSSKPTLGKKPSTNSSRTSSRVTSTWRPPPISLEPEPGRLTVRRSGPSSGSSDSFTFRQLRTSAAHWRGSKPFSPASRFSMCWARAKSRLSPPRIR